MRACEGDYRTGEDVLVRRVPGRPDRTYGDPLPPPGLAGLALVLGGLAGILTAIGAVVSALWEERRRPRLRDRPRRAPPWLRPRRRSPGARRRTNGARHAR